MCLCSLLPPPHTAPQWLGVEQRAEDCRILSGTASCERMRFVAGLLSTSLTFSIAWLRERERERSWNRCCIQLPVFMHSEFITARSLEIPSYFYSVFVIRIFFSLCSFLSGEKYFLCRYAVVCHSCSTSPHTHNTHRRR